MTKKYKPSKAFEKNLAKKIYVAGDSFSSLANDQAEGNSWSELIADKLELELVNIGRPAASNLLIALQIDWITQRIKPEDLVIIYLTDHNRKALVDLSVERDSRKSLLEMHSLHPRQQKSKHLAYSSHPPRIIASHPSFTAASHPNHTKEITEFYKNWFDSELQEAEDIFIITGALAKLSEITDNFLVCSGGFGEYNKNINHDTFSIDSKHFIKKVNSENLIKWTAKQNYINHIDDITHRKVSTLIISHLDKYFS